MFTSFAIAIVAAAAAPLPLKVVGDQITANGKPIHLHGIDVCGMEWSGKGENVTRSVPVAFDRWHANIVRLPLCQDRWFGKTDDSPDGGVPYRKMVDEVVQEASERGKYVLLDLHWSDGNEWGKNIGQRTMPDDNSLLFWKDCAARYKNNPAVLFDLYNEPVECPWSVWRDGGEVTDNVNGSQLRYHAVGMQTLLEVIRGVGAKNVVLAGGLGYSSRLDFPDEAELRDPGGQGVVYGNHFYPGWENIPSWEKRILAFRKRGLPLLLGEFGAEPDQGNVQEAAHRASAMVTELKKLDLNWIAWCFHPQASPCMISDWNYTPTVYFGAYVKAALEGREVAVAPRAESAPDKAVYRDGLAGGWQSWGNGSVDFGYTGMSHGGTKSMRCLLAQGQRLQLGNVPFDGNAYKAVSLWLNGGSDGGQRLVLEASVLDTAPASVVQLPILKANEWIHVVVPFKDLGIEGKEDVKSFTIRPPEGAPEFFLDDFVIEGKR
jgi:hypothetical protein